MAEYVPDAEPGTARTFTVATTAVSGGQLVEVNGNMTVGPAGALSTKVVGVAGNDAAIGALVTVYRLGDQYLTAVGSIAAGDQVVAAAAGTVQTVGANTAFTVIGVALEAITNTNSGRVRLRV